MNIIRNQPRFGCSVCWLTLFTLLLMTIPASAQNVPSSTGDQTVFTGTVASSTHDTLVVRGNDGQFQLFVFDRNTMKPASLPIGSEVRVTSSFSDERGVRVASDVKLLKAAPAGQAAPSPPPAVPPEVRRLEREIERQTRRYGGGVRAGVALDPELVLIGVQGQVGPFFNSGVYFRPNVEFAYGEVTALFGVNLEAIYRLPITSRLGRWSTYFGIGPGFNFLHQNFESGTGEGSRIDFGDFRSDTALNILGGVQYRSGMFLEMKASIYSEPAPTFRLIIGYTF